MTCSGSILYLSNKSIEKAVNLHFWAPRAWQISYFVQDVLSSVLWAPFQSKDAQGPMLTSAACSGSSLGTACLLFSSKPR